MMYDCKNHFLEITCILKSYKKGGSDNSIPQVPVVFFIKKELICQFADSKYVLVSINEIEKKLYSLTARNHIY